MSRLDIADCMVDIRLTYHEARMVRTALKAKAGRYEALAERSTYIPPAGKIDKNKEGAICARSAEAKVDQAITTAINRFKGRESNDHENQ